MREDGPVTSVDPSELLELAAHAARRAGSLLVEGRPADGPQVVETKSSPTDVVTAMDTAAERSIVETIRARRPADAILAEEGSTADGADGVEGGASVRWVIDPLDGTTNYLYGLPEWAVSIAAEVRGQFGEDSRRSSNIDPPQTRAVAGVVYVASRGEMFTAVRGQGARCNGELIRCAAATPLERALVATGFDYDRDFRAHQGEVVRGVLPAVRDLRRGGCCSADLCSVAAGRVDAFYERARQPWDIAAGALIAHEAGARVGGPGGAAPDERLVLAAQPALFDPLQDLLVSLDPALATPSD